MPSDKVLEQKKQAVSDITQQLEDASAGILVDYKGISVEKDAQLRKELRDAGVEYTVVKNTLLRRAVDNAELGDLKNDLVGPTALAISKDDPVAPAKILSKYEKELKTHFKIKGGFIDGRVVDLEEIDKLSNLPSFEELIAKMLGSLNAPASGLVNVLTGNVRGLVIALNEIAQKEA